MYEKFFVLYLIYGHTTVIEAPIRFSSMEECQATFNGSLYSPEGAGAKWSTASDSRPVGQCMPVVVKK